MKLPRRFQSVLTVNVALAAMCVVPVVIMAQNQAGSAPAAAAPATPLPWAYPLNPPAQPGAQPAAPDTGEHKLPASSKAFTRKQVTDLFNPPDWYPEDHPAMPEIVAHGRRPDVRACGYCHLPNGQGRTENASLAGLSAGYIVQQMADYRNGLRKSSEPKMGPPSLMLTLGKAANEEEAKSAGEYFSKLKYKPWIRVVEAKMVPKTQVEGWILVPEGAGEEPIGMRIIETPESHERFELRDSMSGFVAYVPTGSLKKGEELVTKGGSGKTLRCSICHGEGLKGLGNVPFLAGRSPSYLVRQMYDFKMGNRQGVWSPLMKEAVSKLSTEDMVAIAAYAASLKP
jgi:cytochrome c553